jgi:integrase
MSRFDNISPDEANSLPVYAVELNSGEGSPRLIVTIRGPSEQIFDCTGWLHLGNDLVYEFGDAFARENLGLQPRTRTLNYQYLSNGFITWVKEKKLPQEIGIAQLKLALFNDFDKWLVEKDSQGTFLRGATATLAHWRSALIGVIKGLKSGPIKDSLPDDCRMQRAPLAKHGKQGSHVEPYQYEEFGNILVAIRKDIQKSLQYFDQRERLLRMGHRALDLAASGHRGISFDRDTTSKARLLAKLQRAYGPVLPPAKFIKAERPDLYEELVDYGTNDIYPILHPSCNDLIAFAYQISVLTGLNSQPLWDLKFGHGVRTVRAFGAERVVFSEHKIRKGDVVTAAYVDTDEELSAPYIIRRVKAWTEDLRSVAHEDIKSDVWLFVPRHNSQSREVRSMRTSVKDPLNPDVNNAATAFAKRHNVPRVAPSRVRATLAALAHDIFGGDLRAVMDFLQHSRPEVTLRNYTNGVSVARHHEIIATVQQLRERYILTDGTLDPRVLAQSGDPSAATPGWQCFDPFSSPMPGQRSGSMCDAYGSCPACPHALINPTSPVACARVIQVKTELEKAKHRVLPERWALSLARQHAAIEGFWLHVFSADTRQQAERVHTSPIVPFE